MPKSNCKPSRFFEAVKERRFGVSICFLCGCKIGKKNKADEHVIPLWLQKKFHLLNERITLSNQTQFQYKGLKIPCCLKCNRDLLGPIENKVKKAIEIGPKEVRKIPKNELFVWLGKIFYGLLYKELFLRFNQKSKSKATITSRELLHQYYLHHLFLQSVRFPIHFKQFFPASIFIFESQVPKEEKHQFDYYDSLDHLFLSLRIGKVIIIANLQDGMATQKQLIDLQKDFSRFPLHPIQYSEMNARILYARVCLNRVPKYITMETDKKITIVQMPLAGLSSKPIFDDFEKEEYMKYLAHFSQHPIEVFPISKTQIFSWLINSDKKKNKIELKTHPWPPQ